MEFIIGRSAFANAFSRGADGPERSKASVPRFRRTLFGARCRGRIGRADRGRHRLGREAVQRRCKRTGLCRFVFGTPCGGSFRRLGAPRRTADGSASHSASAASATAVQEFLRQGSLSRLVQERTSTATQEITDLEPLNRRRREADGRSDFRDSVGLVLRAWFLGTWFQDNRLMPTVSFVILQPTPFCNISCRYCYLPNRSSRAHMTLATIEKVFSGLFSSGWVGNELYVAWHGGEPLVLPMDYYEQAFRVVADHTPAHVTVEHAFQTNGMLIDDAWCAFFKRHKATVGVSIDGPEEVHDANRIARSGRGTYSEVIEGIRRLRRNDVRFCVITVLSALSLRRPKEMHDFYRSEGITDVCFNVEEIEGTNAHSSLLGDEMRAAHENFMRQIWNLNVASGALSYIREFKDMLQKVIRPSDGTEIDNTLTTPFEHLNVDYRGNFSTFSPEFLGHKNAYYRDFIVGNFWNGGLAQSLESEAFKRLNRDVAAGVEMCRRSCEYFSVCGGGSPVNKLYENGTIASCETMYCRLGVKAIADLAMEIIDSSAAQDALLQ